jgi:hypothetical protein
MRDVGRALDYWAQQASLEAAEGDAHQAHQRRRLHLSQVGNMVHIDGRLDRVDGEVVMTALNSITDPANLDPTDTRTPAQRRADALVRLCKDHLDHGDVPVQRHGRPHVLVHVSLEALEGRAGRPCETDQTGVITPAQARRLACDAAISRVITRGDSQILDVGRTTRTIPHGIRMAVIARDRRCVNCGAPARWCDVHHLHHWADGGHTAVANACLLCDHCHGRIHDGTLQLPQDLLDQIRRRDPPPEARLPRQE